MASEIKANKISPATGTAFTIGDSGDTFTVPSGATLAVASGATISNAGTASGFGKVLQVVQATKTDTASTTSTSFVSTGLEVTITPSSASSKILVSVTANCSSGSDVNSLFVLWRDSTTVSPIGDAAGSRKQATFASPYQDGGGVYNHSVVGQYLDSPATTSAVTYKLAWAKGYAAGAGTLYLNRSNYDADVTNVKRLASIIIATEIAG